MAAGSDAGYLGESSSKYLNHLKVALTSIRKSCPSIIPVVVVINNISVETKRWITALGATVVKHDLTVAKHVYKTAALEEWSWIKGVISTYLRIEVPHTLECAAVLVHGTQPLKAQLLLAACVHALGGQSQSRFTGAPHRGRGQAPVRLGAGGPAVCDLGRPRHHLGARL